MSRLQEADWPGMQVITDGDEKTDLTPGTSPELPIEHAAAQPHSLPLYG